MGKVSTFTRVGNGSARLNFKGASQREPINSSSNDRWFLALGGGVLLQKERRWGKGRSTANGKWSCKWGNGKWVFFLVLGEPVAATKGSGSGWSKEEDEEWGLRCHALFCVVSVMKHFHACFGTKRRERAQPNSKEGKKKYPCGRALSEARPDFRLCEWNRASPPKLMDKEKEEWE